MEMQWQNCSYVNSAEYFHGPFECTEDGVFYFLQKGAGEIAQAFRLSSDIADIATGIILFFIIGCEFFLNYRIMFRHKGKEGK